MSINNPAIKSAAVAIAAGLGLPALTVHPDTLETTIGQPWARLTFVAASERKTSNALMVARGTVSLDLFWPKEMSAAADALAETVKGAFLPDQALGPATIDYAEVRATTLDGQWYRVPVVIGWIAYASITPAS